MAWSFTSRAPVYMQIVSRIRADILGGVYKPDQQIPAVRQLALTAGVNPNTMQKAFAALEQSGLICTQRTSGRTVTEDIEVIKGVQKDLASSHITQFIQKMKELGFTNDEIKNLVESTIEEGKYE